MTTNYLLVHGSEADTIAAKTLDGPLTAREIFAVDEAFLSGSGDVNLIACELASQGWTPVESRVYSASGHNLSNERKQEVQEKAFALIIENSQRTLFDYLTSDEMLGTTFITNIVMTRGEERVLIGDNGNIDVDSDFPLMVIIAVVTAANNARKFRSN